MGKVIKIAKHSCICPVCQGNGYIRVSTGDTSKDFRDKSKGKSKKKTPSGLHTNGDEFTCNWETGERDGGGDCLVPICLPEGEHIYSLLVIDEYGAESILNQTIIVNQEPNTDPIAVSNDIVQSADHYCSDEIHTTTISIDGEDSFDPDGDSITCSWISTTDACGDECSSDECSFDITLEPGDYLSLIHI